MTSFLNVGDQLLEVQQWSSDRPGPTLVLVHEGLGCVSLWRDFPARLHEATGLPICAYSRAGYGRSSGIDLPRPLDFHTREALAVLPRVLDAAKIDDCILVGHSDGASIAIIYAGAIRDPRVRALALLAPHVLTEMKTVMNISAAKRSFEASDLRTKLARHHAANVDNAFWGWCDAWLDPGFRQWNITTHLAAITVPVLTLRGADDAYNTPVHVDAIATQVSGPVTRIDLADCGHVPQLDQPGLVLEHLQRFVIAVTAPLLANG